MPTRTGHFAVKILKSLPDKQCTPAFLVFAVVTLIALLGIQGCASQRQSGLLEVDTHQLLLQRRAGGQPLVLIDTTDPALMRGLAGCIVEVEGRRHLFGFRVNDWRVLDAGDGSMPYIGVLRRHGTQVALADRQTGRLVKLTPEQSGSYRKHIGQWVMIVGFQVASDTIRVVDFRLLND